MLFLQVLFRQRIPDDENQALEYQSATNSYNRADFLLNTLPESLPSLSFPGEAPLQEFSTELSQPSPIPAQTRLTSPKNHLCKNYLGGQ